MQSLDLQSTNKMLVRSANGRRTCDENVNLYKLQKLVRRCQKVKVPFRWFGRGSDSALPQLRVFLQGARSHSVVSRS